MSRLLLVLLSVWCLGVCHAHELVTKAEAKISIPVWKNWCGPGHPGGPLPPKGTGPKPADEIDAVCMEHDYCFEKLSEVDHKNYYWDCKCNRDMVNSLKKIKVNRDHSTGFKVFKSAAAKFFAGIPCECNNAHKGKEVFRKLVWNYDQCYDFVPPDPLPSEAFCSVLVSRDTAPKYYAERFRKAGAALFALGAFKKSAALMAGLSSKDKSALAKKAHVALKRSASEMSLAKRVKKELKGSKDDSSASGNSGTSMSLGGKKWDVPTLVQVCKMKYRHIAEKIKIIRATKLPKEDTFSQTDAYVAVKIVMADGSVKSIGKTKHKQDKANPVWNETFDIPVGAVNVLLAVVDDDIVIDDPVATVSVLEGELTQYSDTKSPELTKKLQFKSSKATITYQLIGTA